MTNLLTKFSAPTCVLKTVGFLAVCVNFGTLYVCLVWLLRGCDGAVRWHIVLCTVLHSYKAVSRKNISTVHFLHIYQQSVVVILDA